MLNTQDFLDTWIIIKTLSRPVGTGVSNWEIAGFIARFPEKPSTTFVNKYISFTAWNLFFIICPKIDSQSKRAKQKPRSNKVQSVLFHPCTNMGRDAAHWDWLQKRLNKTTEHCKYTRARFRELLRCDYFSFDVKNDSKSMRWKVSRSLSQELALFTSLRHIICSISHSRWFSLSCCRARSHNSVSPHASFHQAAPCACACAPAAVGAGAPRSRRLLSIYSHLGVSWCLDPQSGR